MVYNVAILVELTTNSSILDLLTQINHQKNIGSHFENDANKKVIVIVQLVRKSGNLKPHLREQMTSKMIILVKMAKIGSIIKNISETNQSKKCPTTIKVRPCDRSVCLRLAYATCRQLEGPQGETIDLEIDKKCNQVDKISSIFNFRSKYTQKSRITIENSV